MGRFHDMPRRFWLWLLIFRLLMCAIPASSAASVEAPAPHLRRPSLTELERRAWRNPIRASEFNDVPHSSARSRCEETQLPEALTTPDPLLVPFAGGARVKVSFIVGADGRVHSPLILESAGPVGDRYVLQTVRSWRYRPATCNGVPTEFEGRIEFSSR
jgi:TonB family protein